MKTIIVLLIAFAFSTGAKAQSIKKNRTITSSGISRTYQVYLPADFKSRTQPAQVVVAFHPAGPLGGKEFADMTLLHQEPGSENAVFVYPDGLMASNGKRSWDADIWPSNANDVAFFDAILKDVARFTPIKSKVAITGYSSGAMMVYRLLCDRSEKISAAIPFAAYLPDKDISDVSRCPWTHSVPFVHTHGDQDAQMKINGQSSAYFPGSPYTTSPLNLHMQLVAEANGGFTGKERKFSIGPGTIVTEHNAYTYSLIYEDLGHIWPGYDLRPGSQYGPDNLNYDGTGLVMWFLLAF